MPPRSVKALDFHIELRCRDFEARKGLIQNVLTKAGKDRRAGGAGSLGDPMGGFKRRTHPGSGPPCCWFCHDEHSWYG